MSNIEPDRDATQWPEAATEVPLEPVTRVIYASRCDVEGPVLDEMRRIRDQAVVNNSPHHIKVALLYMCGWFVEWVEGPQVGVDALLERVASDPRHFGMRLIHRSEGRPRLFRPWIGSIVQSQESAPLFFQRVVAEEKRRANGESGEPAGVWWRLCSPPAPDMPRPLGRNPRAMLVSAQGQQVFDLLEWLARVKQRQLVRRRFAGGAEDAPDVESDYLDLPDVGQRGWRLIVKARKGLAMGMTHAFLPEYGVVVVLLDASASRNRRILDRVLAACQQVHHVPAIVGLGVASSVTPELQELVERQGLPWLSAVCPSESPQLDEIWLALERVLLQLD